MARILVALGGNALQQRDCTGRWEEARRQVRHVTPVLAEVARTSERLVITHGNGPQVGVLLRQNELGRGEVPALPLDVLGAETQGQIGYLIQGELTTALEKAQVHRSVLTIISRIEVRRNDPAFRRPTKPVGRYYTEAEARLLRKTEGWVLEQDRARGGWRRLVPSPVPQRWLEGRTVRRLLEGGGGARWVPIVAGGGGIPVVRGPAGAYEGVEAVIDKDLAAALVARELGVDTFTVVTDVPGAALNFGRTGERWLGEVAREDLARWYRAGEFAEGSMGPKVEAALDFLRRGGQRVVITDIPSLPRALRGQAGTRIG